MTRFAAVKHQRVVALAKDMSAAADAIVKLRDQARRNKRDPGELPAEELRSGKGSVCLKTRRCTTTRRSSPLL
jgi:hypothetical protein